MVLKTATYSGMNLKGEIRESISLDEDDLSDVEDEVFIRDGKNGFKVSKNTSTTFWISDERLRAVGWGIER